MTATLTLVLCLLSSPESCELKEVRVDAQACFYGGSNVANEHTPPGYALRSARCVPEMRRPRSARM